MDGQGRGHGARTIADDISATLSELKQIRSTYEETLQDITDMVCPRRSHWELEATEGQKPRFKTYDTTAIEAANTVVDGLHGRLVSQHTQWFRLSLTDRDQLVQPGVADWLEYVGEVISDEFSASNFYQAANEFFGDGVGPGTATMVIDDDPAEPRIIYSTRHPKECYISENRHGFVDTVYREYRMRNRDIVKEWPDTVCEQRRTEAKNNPFGRATIIHAVQPRADHRPWMREGIHKRYASIYLDAAHMEEPLEEGGYDEFPYLVWRWRKNSDETYGRSPGWDALPDLYRINGMARDMLIVGQKAAQPPWMIPEGLRGKERLVPNGYNYVSGGEEIKPILAGEKYPIALDQVNDIKEQIKAHFRVRAFLLMEQIGQTSGRTATEIRERVAEIIALLGPIIGRLNSEFLIPAIQRTYNILSRRGKIPSPPYALAQVGKVHIEFMGLLAQSQKRYHQSTGITAGLQFAATVLQLNQQSGDNVNWDELMRIGLDVNGMPQKIIREKDEVEQLRQAQAEALQAQAEQEAGQAQAEMISKNADKLNQPVNSGSMLEGVAQNAEQQAQARRAE